jgi:hypothetical protein
VSDEQGRSNASGGVTSPYRPGSSGIGAQAKDERCSLRRIGEPW